MDGKAVPDHARRHGRAARLARLGRRGLAGGALLALAGCGGGGGTGAAETLRTVDVARALRAPVGELVTVRAALHVDSGHARLCAALAESFPPQCTGRSLRIHGIHLDSVAGLQQTPDESIQWAERVEVRGRVEAPGELRAE